MGHETQKKNWAIERRWVRYRIDVRLKMNYQKDGQPAFAFGQGSDVSEGGMAAYIPVEVPVGERVELEIKLPYSKQQIRVSAVVRNRNDFRYGLEYDALPAQEREQLARSLKVLASVQ
jgi:c-di-GMP-binding flagellar brake protein YcgR